MLDAVGHASPASSLGRPEPEPLVEWNAPGAWRPGPCSKALGTRCHLTGPRGCGCRDHDGSSQGGTNMARTRAGSLAGSREPRVIRTRPPSQSKACHAAPAAAGDRSPAVSSHEVGAVFDQGAVDAGDVSDRTRRSAPRRSTRGRGHGRVFMSASIASASSRRASRSCGNAGRSGSGMRHYRFDDHGPRHASTEPVAAGAAAAARPGDLPAAGR